MKLRNPLVAALAFSASVLVSSLGLLAPTYAQSDATDQPSAPPLPMLAQPVASPVPSLATATYRAKSPEYGMNVFVWGNAGTTDRDLGLLRSAGFTWQKSLFRWNAIEPQRGVFDWSESDRVIRASAAAGVKVIARLDFQPDWARADHAHNGPPDDYADFGRFVTALATRYGANSAIGPLQAIEVWNEPNLNREWGMQPIDKFAASEYVRLLKTAYQAAKAVEPAMIVVTAGLSPTGWSDDTARPDDLYLQWMYEAGARAYFDVLGAHGPGFKAPPDISPEEAANSPLWGGHRSFTFRRVEDLRKIMVANGDAAKQIWLLEFGWTTDEVNPSYAWHRVTPDQQAEYLLSAYKWAHDNWSPWIGVMTLWTLPDPSWGPEREEYWWAVANPDGSDRPALTRLRDARRTGLLP